MSQVDEKPSDQSVPETQTATESPQLPVCGMIMPISAMPPHYSAEHWSDVREIIEEAVVAAGMRAQMASDSIDSDVIQQRIISNIFNNPVVICDASGLNPNVMFELGMRLASKKATIILTDDYATLPFDTRIIEHLSYPRGLHLRHTRQFIEKLKSKIETCLRQVSSETYKPFLDNFAGIEPHSIGVKEVPEAEYIRLQLERIEGTIASLIREKHSISKISHDSTKSSRSYAWTGHNPFQKSIFGSPISLVVSLKEGLTADDIRRILDNIDGLLHYEISYLGKNLVISGWVHEDEQASMEAKVRDTLYEFGSVGKLV